MASEAETVSEEEMTSAEETARKETVSEAETTREETTSEVAALVATAGNTQPGGNGGFNFGGSGSDGSGDDFF